MRIALVEDHPRVAALVRDALARAGLALDVYDTLAAARYWLRRQSYAALVLDRGMPDGDGLELLASLRAEGWTPPCLVLTARDALHDRVDGLEHGADDYLAKPFAIEELIARMRALLRRRPTLSSMRYCVGNVCVDAGAALVCIDDAMVRLPATEYRLLLALAEVEGGMLSHAQSMDAAFGPFAATSRNALDVLLHRLRARLLAHGATASIVNHRGVGHALVPSATR
jgi:DNA-binding response OmpR family regulator